MSSVGTFLKPAEALVISGLAMPRRQQPPCSGVVTDIPPTTPSIPARHSTGSRSLSARCSHSSCGIRRLGPLDAALLHHRWPGCRPPRLTEEFGAASQGPRLAADRFTVLEPWISTRLDPRRVSELSLLRSLARPVRTDGHVEVWARALGRTVYHAPLSLNVTAPRRNAPACELRPS